MSTLVLEPSWKHVAGLFEKSCWEFVGGRCWWPLATGIAYGWLWISGNDRKSATSSKSVRDEIFENSRRGSTRHCTPHSCEIHKELNASLLPERYQLLWFSQTTRIVQKRMARARGPDGYTHAKATQMLTKDRVARLHLRLAWLGPPLVWC